MVKVFISAVSQGLVVRSVGCVGGKAEILSCFQRVIARISVAVIRALQGKARSLLPL